MTISRFPLLVSCHWLREQIYQGIQKTKPNLQVLDSSWLPDRQVNCYKEFYSQSHIPSSQHFDLNEITPQRDNSIANNVPDSNVFQDYVEELGISNNTHVVAYDHLDSKAAFRSWFLFRLFGHDNISVLNGGLKQWLTHGFSVTTEEPHVERGKFTPNFRPHLLRDYEQMMKNIKSQEAQVLDSRGYKIFAGSVTENTGGHIPNSINIPFASLYNEDGTFKSVEDLTKLFNIAQVNLNKPVIATCQTAMTACSLAAAAFLLGKEDVPVYNGSFTEWNARADPNNISRIEKKD